MSRKRKILLVPAVLLILSAGGGAHSTRYANGAESYAKDSNRELQRKALALVKNIRNLVYTYNKKDKALTDEYQSEYLATRTTERQALTQRWRAKSDEAFQTSLRDYQKNFSPECTRIRDELQKRLPKRLQRPNARSLYTNPSNVLALDVIGDDLELLAKSLPDSE